MGNNPAGNVDPDGGWDDWYLPDGGTSAVWLESSDQNLAGYTWIGDGDYEFFGKHLGEASVTASRINRIIQRVYDIDKAVNYLNDHAYPVYDKNNCGNCARAVRLAITAGGINTDARPKSKSAKDYGPYIEEWGFSLVNEPNYLPVRGDVRVIQNHPEGSIHGHMDMYNGFRWVSDYMQNGTWPGPGYRKYKPTFQIYRWERNFRNLKTQ